MFSPPYLSLNAYLFVGRASGRVPVDWMKTKGVTRTLQETMKDPLIAGFLSIGPGPFPSVPGALPSRPEALPPQLDGDQRRN